MNNKRRKLLSQARGALDVADEIISRIIDEEQDCLDNIPENLQMSDRYESMEAAVDCLEDARCNIDEARNRINEASA